MIRQTEAAECGLACLAMVANHHGQQVDLATLRRRHPISLKGATLKALIEIGAAMGLGARAVRCELEELKDLKRPAILHWGMNHFVVLAKAGRRRCTILDPAVGERTLTYAQISQHFTGVALELSPTEGFQRKRERQILKLSSLVKLTRPAIGALLQAVLLSVLIELFVLAGPFYMQLVIDEAILKGDADLLSALAIGFGGVMLFQVVATTLRGLTLQHLSISLGFDMGAKLFHHLLRLPLDWFHKRQVGDIQSRFRSMQPVQQFISNGANGALLRRYVHGPGVDEPLVWYEGAGLGDRRGLLANHQGSIVGVTNASGGVLYRNTYEEYGARGGADAGRFSFTGQIAIPELGLLHYKARAYNTAIGRFMQTDPVGYDDQMNLYAYVGNDPVSQFDPDGKDSISVHFRDQPIHALGGTIPQALSNGHSGIVNINESNGFTKYYEFGRYNDDPQVRSIRIPNLTFRNGAPTAASVSNLLRAIIAIGARANSSDIEVTWDAGTNFAKIEAYVASVKKSDPNWSPWGMNCHTFCKQASRAGGGSGPTTTTTITDGNITQVANAIEAFYKEQRKNQPVRVCWGAESDKACR